ncbi:SDR family NAD(P)-dependent oxidoreductase [Frigidibacter sp. MR17.24]|uniref:SDR family NAD(P)-dependent oxidoreductase n=1 Tax=Frigidibacter sp. MR17.24 TaxID=3127345 RepID=UPI0030131AD1
MTNDLSGQVALVTGGAQGLGAAIAAGLAERGARVALTGRSDMAGAAATAARLGGRAYAMDLTDRGSVETAFDRIAAELGPPEIVVNNAGASARGKLLALSGDDWDHLFAVHARGFFHVATAAARRMIAAGVEGAIIGIAGASAQRCYPGAGAYAPSKAAVLAAARQMAVEWAPHRIRVNCVLPGPVRPADGAWQAHEPALAEEVLKIPLSRAGTPEEVAEAVAYLAGARYVTGQELVIDGGSTTTWYIQG